MKVIIPAAGLGKRFVASGVTSPKELLRLGGRPLIGHALVEARRAGFEAAVVVVSPAKEALRNFLTGSDLPLPVEVVVQPEPRGIGDAVLRCWSGQPIGVLLPDDVVLVSNHWAELIQLNAKSGAAALCVRPVSNELAGRFGIVERQGDLVVRVIEKPAPGTTASNLAIFGRYVATDRVIAGLAASQVPGELELTYGFAAAINTAEGVRAVDFRGDIFDCGTPEDYAVSVTRFPGAVSRDVPTVS